MGRKLLFVNFTFAAAVIGMSVAAVAGSGAGITIAAGWTYNVFAEDLPKVDNIAVRADGSIYVTLELKRGHGSVVRLSGGRRTVTAEGFNKPDGLALSGSHLFVSEEAKGGRIIRIDLSNDRKTEVA